MVWRDEMTIEELKDVLSKVYIKQIAYPDCQEEWSEGNPTYGQCAVTALVVQNYFGGEICKCNNLAHYFNKIGGKIVDLTSEQFNFEVDYSNSIVKQPDMSKADMQKRYLLLKTRVEEYMSKSVEAFMADEIKNCNKCGELPKLVCNSLKTGKSRVLVLGESPAKDGWIVSGKAFYNKDGKLQASGRILNKLLNLCNMTIDDINFTEVCKCVIADRKMLRQCCDNCKPILFKQLDKFECDVILPMGQFPTETILGRRVNKLSDVVGKVFKIKFGETTKTVVPVYHTSPANPLCYKGNEKIFKEILCNILQY